MEKVTVQESPIPDEIQFELPTNETCGVMKFGAFYKRNERLRNIHRLHVYKTIRILDTN